MQIKCLIIDDEPAAIRVIENYLENMPGLHVVAKCKSAFEAIEYLNTSEIDLLFLDINMPGLSGIDFLKSLRKPPLVIITTAYREYALESFELEVIDYLHKPFSFERFFKAVQRVEEVLTFRKTEYKNEIEQERLSKDYIFIKSEKRHYKIKYSDLLFIESMGDYCKLITLDKAYLSNLTLKKLVELLPESFLRVHKSFIVQVNKIDVVEGNNIKIQKHNIPIGFSYRKEIFELLNH